MLINSLNCSTCLFSWYGLLIWSVVSVVTSVRPDMFVDIMKVFRLFYSDLPQTTFNKAISDLRKHLNACVSADGGHFEHVN